ncbi:MAG: hypothetical protein V8T62_00415 [Oscillospiraceae bacterium]
MEKKGVIWNTLGSGVFAANSVLLLLIVSRVFGVAAAGDFGIVFTTAQILYIIGLFGINHFQMTDYAEQYSFASYRAAKWITTAAMICGCLVLLFFGGNTRKQAWLLLLLTMYMAVHSFAELYQSRFFQKNRLDLCGKSLFYRTFFSLCCFAVLSATIHNLYIASAGMVLTNLVTMYIWSFCPSKAMGAENRMGKKGQLLLLFQTTIPLAVSLFLMNVMANLSKYVVNYYESNTVQGYFNILFLPTQVINLLSGFVFKPLLSQYGAAVGERDFIRFRQLYRRHLFLIGGLTVFCCLAGYLLGTQVLGLFYAVDLSAYRLELFLTILSGGFIAAGSMSYYLLVMLRKQMWIFLNYAVNIGIGVVISVLLVKNFSILGGALSILVSQALLFFVFAIFLLFFTRRTSDA